MVKMNRRLDPVVSASVQRLSSLKGVLATELFHLAEEFSGVTEPQLRTVTGEKSARIDAALTQLMNGRLLVRHPVYRLADGGLTSDAGKVGSPALPIFNMHYLSDEGAIIVEHRDFSSLARIRRRVHEDIRKDHADDRAQLFHTLQLNDCIAALAKAEYDVSAGYRGCLYLPGGRQLVPDARMAARCDIGEHATEFIGGNPNARAAREEVRARLREYVPTARTVPGLQVIVLCHTRQLIPVVVEEAASICREYQVDLEVVPFLEQNVVVGPAREGMPEVWRSILLPLKFYIEYERSAVERQDIREKLMPYVRVALAGYPSSVIFICESQRAAKLFQEEHRKLEREHRVSFTLITSTHQAVTTEARDGCPWSMDGRPVRLN